MILRIRTGLCALFTILTLLPITLAASNTSTNEGTRWVTYVTPDGTTEYLEDDRKPALYTGNYGDCLGNSLINVTRFDAAYYNDNMTVLIHLAGHTAVANDSVMMYIGVYAYGESRFDLVFDPCNTGLNGLCPLNSSNPISANGIIPVDDSDVANVPNIAYSIPDFEGEAILRIFSNTTQQEIACYSGVVTNGNSFSQPAAVGTVLGVFALVAMIASFATAIYGEAVPTMRLHYAHSMSVGVVFAVFQHIFFTGAISVNWPSCLVAWWSNFAWAGGMIYSSSMQSSINHFIGNDVGNTTEVGAAQAGSYQANLGGGFDLSQIYKRMFSTGIKRAANHPLMRDIAYEIYSRDYSKTLKRDLVTRAVEYKLQARDVIANASTGYKWYGHPVYAGLPLPGNFSGFAGTLAEEGIRVSNAFMTGFLWFLILLAVVIGAVVALKWILEGLARAKWARIVKQDTLSYFREHWIGYTVLAALRTCYIAFFMIMLLTIFEFTYNSSAGVKALAAIVFAIFFLGIPGAAYYAMWYERNITAHRAEHEVKHKRLFGKIPWFAVRNIQPDRDNEDQRDEIPTGSKSSSTPFWKRRASIGSIRADNEGHMKSIHDDEDFTKKFGWLASRFRRTRWWFFTVWIFYELVRAVFYGGASGSALAQVFGLLVVEIIALVYVFWAKPFEGQRLNLLVVYCLGFSKVTTVALSAAFDVQFNLARIPTTVIGIVIIVIQGILTIITMIAIAVGAISSYMSVSRNQEDFRPRKWLAWRERYFNHLDRAVNDLPPEPKPEPPPPEEPKFGFEMKNMSRVAKIEDEDEEFATEMRADPRASYGILEQSRTASPVQRSGNGTPVQRSRAGSMQSVNLPYGARSHRPSWSTRDFTPLSLSGIVPTETAYSPIDMNATVPDDEPVATPPPALAKHGRKPSRSATNPTPPSSLSTRPAPAPRHHASSDSIQVGGTMSTRDTIGTVPAPATRPRAGSARGSRPASRTSGVPHIAADNYSRLSDSLLGGPDCPGPRGSAGYATTAASRSSQPLAPTQEFEEWNSAPRAGPSRR